MVMVDAMTKSAARVVAQLVVLNLILSQHFEGSVYTRHSALCQIQSYPEL
jgi:hypothetical protein